MNVTFTTTTTTEAITRALWNADASDIEPDGSWFGIHLDPDGPAERACPYTGVVRRGWPVRRMTGDEPVVLRDDGRTIHLDAESWVQDRIGAARSGRDARKLRARIMQADFTG